MKYLSFLLLAFSMSANSVPITDTVTADGKEWAQADLFIGLSWLDINSVCSGGACSAGGELNGYDMTGWLWVGINGVADLFNDYIGTPVLDPPDTVSLVEADSSWAVAFFDSGWRPTSIEAEYDLVLQAWASDSFSSEDGLLGRVGELVNRPLTPHKPTLDIADVGQSINANAQNYPVGAWFYRPVEISTPSTLSLLGLALTGLGWFTTRGSRSRYSRRANARRLSWRLPGAGTLAEVGANCAKVTTFDQDPTSAVLNVSVTEKSCVSSVR